MPKTKIFIEKARAKHGDRYDYSKVVYTRSKDKVVITCKEHGEFEQRPDNHLAGRNCALCAGTHNYSTTEWIYEAKRVHGDRYDYGEVVYARKEDKVIITCKAHGNFEQRAGQHLNLAQGCPACGVESRLEKIEKPTEVWVNEAVHVHGDRYDYSKSIYTRAKDKVVITCKEHGDFEQTAETHLGGSGCPRCKWSRERPTSVYLMQMGELVKIGISVDPDARLSDLNRSNPKPAHIINIWTLEDFPTAYAVEQRIHSRLAVFNAGLSGFNGASEWFNVTPYEAERVISEVIG